MDRAKARRHVLAASAMGTRFEVVLFGEELPRLQSAGEAALAEVCALSDQLNAFSGGSVVSYINEHAAIRAVPVDAEVFALLDLCREGWAASEGAFDITIGPLMEAWGFRGQTTRSRSDIEAARARVGMDKVDLDRERGTVRFAVHGMRLDLGGVAKGYALDVAAGILRAAGVERALMHGGTSSVIAIGSPPAESAWRVRAGQDTLALRDESLSVSAPRGRTIETDEGATGHVLDPRIGAPTRGAEMAWAICKSAAWAEVWSTAMLVLKRRPAGMLGSVRALVQMTSNPEVCA
jgi:thiamine biosynthesis lipoprotein